MRTRIILANLQRRPMRSLVSVVAVALEVILILMIVGLVNGMINDKRSRISGIGADIVVRSGSGSMFAELSGNTLPLKLAGVFARVPGVAAVAPTAYSLINGAEAVGGVDLASFDRVSGGFHFVHGRAFLPGSREAIVDDLEAAGKHYHLGDPITLLGQTFHIVGIFEHGMGSRIFVDLSMLDSLSASPGKAAVFWIKTDPGAQVGDVAAALHKLVPADTVDSLAQYLSLFTPSRISPAVPIFQKIMITIAIAIGFLVIFLSLYTTVLERTREIGILKSLGASRAYIVGLIVRESELLAGVGILIGIAFAVGLWIVLRRIFPTVPIEMTAKWMALAIVIALASSISGALYPAYKAAGQDAIAALAYE